MLHCTASENVMKTSVMEFISENSWWLKPVNYYSKKLRHRDLHNIFWDIANDARYFDPSSSNRNTSWESWNELVNSSVIMQKGESQNGCYEKTKRTKFTEKRIFFTPWYWGILLTPGYFLPPDTGSKECSFFGKFGVLCFPVTPIWDSPFCLIIDEFSRKISFQDFIKPLEVPQRSVKIKI